MTTIIAAKNILDVRKRIRVCIWKNVDKSISVLRLKSEF